MTAPLCIFWTIWRERNRLVFEDVNISVNRMKYTFLCNLWSWVNLYSVEKPRSLVDFLTWVGCKGSLCFLLRAGRCALLFAFPSGALLYLLYTLGFPRFLLVV